ncbi:MAG: hypothetical protein M3P84_12515 [Chloroflexota bacterium]|nr:hypothetical protein [Chloroflexota bacterium]
MNSATGSAAAGRPSARSVVWLQRLATALAVVAVAEASGVLLISAVGDERFRIGFELPVVGFLASVVLFPIVGALIVQRRPVTRVPWLMITIGLGFGFALLTYGYGTIGTPPGRPLPGAAEALVISQTLFVPVPGAAVAWLLLLFPTDRLLSPRWKAVGFIAVGGTVLYGVASLLKPGSIDQEMFPAFRNPFGLAPAWAGTVDLIATIGNTMLTGGIVLGAVSLAVRYRRADVVEAAQIRWIALVAGVAAPLLAIAALQIDPLSDPAFGAGLVMLACLPIAIGIAITRYHLYDIDRLINRALVYGALTAILAGIFTAGIGLAQRAFVAVTGESSDGAIVLTTLVVATLYAPLRKRLEALVDRRFKYDERRFGSYRDEVVKFLTVVEPNRAWDRLTREAVSELVANGAAVVDADGQPIATAGAWPVPPAVTVRITDGGDGPVAILVGSRLDGRAHDPRAIAELRDVAQLVGAAIRPRD